MENIKCAINIFKPINCKEAIGKKILFFDLETCGKDNYTIIEIAAILYDDINKKYIKSLNSIISEYSEGSYKVMRTCIHNITREMLKDGNDIVKVLYDFNKMISECDIICCHNNHFDMPRIIKHFKLFSIKTSYKPIIDTIYIGGRFKIKLDYLYEFLIGEIRTTKHRGEDDVKDLIKCWDEFWKTDTTKLQNFIKKKREAKKILYAKNWKTENMKFGKYKGKSLIIVITDKNYCKWLKNNIKNINSYPYLKYALNKLKS